MTSDVVIDARWNPVHDTLPKRGRLEIKTQRNCIYGIRSWPDLAASRTSRRSRASRDNRRLPLTMATPFAEAGTTLDRTERLSDGNAVVLGECPSNDILRLRTCCRPAAPCRRCRAEENEYHADRPRDDSGPF